MSRPFTTFLIAVALAPGVASGQEREDRRPGALGGTGGIRGVVLDRATGDPIEGALLRLHPLDSLPTQFAPPDPIATDERGRFSLGLVPGRYRIDVERIGYGRLVETLDVAPGKTLETRVELVAEAVELEPILVAVVARDWGDRTGFDERRRMGFGDFITRGDIESRPVARVSDLLRTLPGVRVRTGAFPSQSRVRLRGNCNPEVYLDGVRTAPPFPIDLFLNPEDIEGIEVYRGMLVPARFASRGCGALVIWTRDPRRVRGRPMTWKRIAIISGVVLLAVITSR